MPEPNDVTRRDFLRRAAAAGIAVPSLGAILAACGSDSGGGSTGATGSTGGAQALQLARPDNPVTLPVTDANPPIADNLSPEGGPLKIFGYNDYIWKKILNGFGDRYGVDWQYTVFDTPEQMVAKVQSNGADFDVIVSVTLENVGKLAFGELIQPLNKTYLPHFADVWDTFQSPFYDVGANYTIPYTVYTTGIGYRNDLVTGDVASLDNPYDVLWDAKYAGQTHLLNGSRDTLAAALLRMGEDVNTSDPAVLEQAKQMLLDGVSTMNWKFDHVDYNELGSFSIHQTWSGQVFYYQWFLPKGEDISQYSYVWPPNASGGKAGIATNDVFAIPKGASNPVLAHLLIDYLLEQKNAEHNYLWYEGFQPPLKAFTVDYLMGTGSVPQNLSNILISEEDFNKGVQELELEPAVNQQYEQIYQQVTGGA